LAHWSALDAVFVSSSAARAKEVPVSYMTWPVGWLDGLLLSWASESHQSVQPVVGVGFY
jgi:hypothetical protein